MRLEDVRADVGEIEAIDRRVNDLTAALRARLTPEQFRLVWALRDAAECLAAAEGLLRGRLLLAALARHLPGSSPALRAARRHVLGPDVVGDAPG